MLLIANKCFFNGRRCDIECSIKIQIMLGPFRAYNIIYVNQIYTKVWKIQIFSLPFHVQS